MKLEITGDRWVKCISQDGNIRGVALDAKELVQQIVDVHGLEGLAIQGLGEALIGALLIASYCKGGERINLNVRCSGLIAQALVDAYPDGSCRGYVIEREAFRGTSEAGLWGSGLLSVLRTQNTEGQQPYIGTVPLLTGQFAKDLTFYWVQSEQVPSAVGIAVRSDGKRVTAAGGFLVQAMPGATQVEISAIEQHIHEIHGFAERLGEDGDPIHLLSQIFQDSAFILLEEKPLQFRCDCSRERVERALTLVGTEELEAMLKENQGAEVNCDFCAKSYKFDAENLQRLIAKVRGQD